MYRLTDVECVQMGQSIKTIKKNKDKNKQNMNLYSNLFVFYT